ncbi:DUF302 domain-containing protein [Alkalihalobacterium chitinilyticum]|uniref:DUF302 domain-containing protein n=1 Tax=Alkalihalobacterium chitinilyticum TaxID=2980103 RepID=A0ABT5VH08_9BACI|nr:DUF302 domain-containing protein [Alkalihalobacterium chitinilyticum]MDE5413489.1 DUF302 domain-containing protein [Alkalihalobacterium chitinilyticum]
MFHYTVETNQSVKETIKRLEANLLEDKFGVLWEFDVQQKLNQTGLEFDQSFTVLEVCNPQEAKRVLDNNKLVGYFLPCKIVVYTEDQKTKIGMPKPTALIQTVNDIELNQIAQDIEERLIASIDKSI